MLARRGARPGHSRRSSAFWLTTASRWRCDGNDVRGADLVMATDCRALGTAGLRLIGVRRARALRRMRRKGRSNAVAAGVRPYITARPPTLEVLEARDWLPRVMRRQNPFPRAVILVRRLHPIVRAFRGACHGQRRSIDRHSGQRRRGVGEEGGCIGRQRTDVASRLGHGALRRCPVDLVRRSACPAAIREYPQTVGRSAEARLRCRAVAGEPDTRAIHRHFDGRIRRALRCCQRGRRGTERVAIPPPARVSTHLSLCPRGCGPLRPRPLSDLRVILDVGRRMNGIAGKSDSARKLTLGHPETVYTSAGELPLGI